MFAILQVETARADGWYTERQIAVGMLEHYRALHPGMTHVLVSSEDELAELCRVSIKSGARLGRIP